MNASNRGTFSFIDQRYEQLKAHESVEPLIGLSFGGIDNALAISNDPGEQVPLISCVEPAIFIKA